jgi:3-oxoacyl-(acyl-carrier-protein) synthase
MCQALKMAGCSPESVDYVNAHGTATQANDKSECEAIRAVFGSPSKATIVNSLKASLGHTMGAAGAIETIGCVLSLAHQCIPPTWNFERVDPECAVDCVANLPRNAPLKRILKNSSGFGGSNCSLLIGVC